MVASKIIGYSFSSSGLLGININSGVSKIHLKIKNPNKYGISMWEDFLKCGNNQGSISCFFHSLDNAYLTVGIENDKMIFIYPNDEPEGILCKIIIPFRECINLIEFVIASLS
jgi:hypothetical protein